MGAIPAAGSVSRRREPVELAAWPVTDAAAVEAGRAAAGDGAAPADAVLCWVTAPQAATLTAAARMTRIVRYIAPLRPAR